MSGVERNYVIAIDGLSGTGKTTVGSLLAQTLRFSFISSGLIYRAIAYKVKQLNISPEDLMLGRMLPVDVFQDIRVEGDKAYDNNTDITLQLLTQEVESKVAEVSSLPQIKFLVRGLLRKMVEGRDCVVEGRDIGSFVFPDAAVKFFLTADDEVRAQRRLNVLHHQTGEDILISILDRDRKDRLKEVGSLTCPQDAIVIDTSIASPETVLKIMLYYIEEKCPEILLRRH